MAEHTRRALLRVAGTAAGSASMVGAASGEAAATDMKNPRELGIGPGPNAGMKDKWHDPLSKHIDPDAVRLKHHNDAPWIPGHTYVTSIHAEDLCFWVGKACTFGGVAASVIKKLPYAFLVSLIGCEGVGQAGCGLRDMLDKATVHDFDWVYIYFWPGGFSFLPKP